MHVHQLETASLVLRFDPFSSTVSLKERDSDVPLIQVNHPVFLAPWLDGSSQNVKLTDICGERDTLTFQYECSSFSEMTVQFVARDQEDALDFSCSFVPHGDTHLNRLDLFPEGTGLNFQELVNFRNRHHTHRTWPELLLGGKGCETSTDSTDWQFAPHPTAFALVHNEVSLFCGMLDLAQTFGMRFAAENYQVRHWFLDFGAKPHGLCLRANQRFDSPTFRLYSRKNRDPYQLHGEFGDMLVRAGRIPDPILKHRETWWQEPLYCTWIDQCLGSDARIADELQEQAQVAEENSAVTFLNDALVRRAVAEIENEKLPIRTILIDDGWSVTRGQWEPEPSRFPDLRKLVDDLHEKGFKVVVWWNWAEISPSAVVNPAHLMGKGKLNRHGFRMRDYSNPLTQEEYLKPLFRKLFSSEPDCFDLDGVKTDFLADKVHPDMPLFDPSWRGEENYIYHVTRLFYTELKAIKPDAVHIGCAGNYWLAEFIDINRTYDIPSGNWFDHEERARMLRATTPGCPVAYDFHNFLEGMTLYFKSARRLGASVQIGNVLYYRNNRFSTPQITDSTYRKVVHAGLMSANPIFSRLHGLHIPAPVKAD